MALQKANQQGQEAPTANDFGDLASESTALDNGFDSAPQVQQPPVQASKPQTTASNFGNKPKSQDTYVKFSFTEGGKEIWLKQTQIHENTNIREFNDTRNGYTAFAHPKDAFILVYKTDDSQNYMKGFRDPDQKKGVVARIFVSHTKASTPENPKTWVGCKCDENGVFDENGKMKANTTQVFGNIVGKDSSNIKANLLENNEKLVAARNQSAAPKPSNPQVAPQPVPQAQHTQPPALVPDADLNFDFST